jgi:hypothetical protein
MQLVTAFPPVFVFPRVHYGDHCVKGGPPGCLGLAHPSGWMTEQNFLKVMKHIVNYTRCTLDKPILLTLDNHESHMSISVLDFAKQNGIVMLSFPPHCSHRLQPLDRSVFGPFKKFAAVAQEAWMKNNPGQSMTIYDIPKIVARALPLAATPTNICSECPEFSRWIDRFLQRENTYHDQIQQSRPAWITLTLTLATDFIYINQRYLYQQKVGCKSTSLPSRPALFATCN